MDNLRRISVVNPQLIFNTLPDSNGLGLDDPVHPLPAVHSEMANIIIRTTDYLINKTSRRDDTAVDSPGDWGGQGRIGLEWSGIGSNWRGVRAVSIPAALFQVDGLQPQLYQADQI